MKTRRCHQGSEGSGRSRDGGGAEVEVEEEEGLFAVGGGGARGGFPDSDLDDGSAGTSCTHEATRPKGRRERCGGAEASAAAAAAAAAAVVVAAAAAASAERRLPLPSPLAFDVSAGSENESVLFRKNSIVPARKRSVTPRGGGGRWG